MFKAVNHWILSIPACERPDASSGNDIKIHPLQLQRRHVNRADPDHRHPDQSRRHPAQDRPHGETSPVLDTEQQYSFTFEKSGAHP